MSTRTVAVLLAGGVGVRVGLGIPKQLIKIAGKAIVEHTLDVMNASPAIDEIIIVMNAGAIDQLESLKDPERFPKLTRIIPGGDTRNDSTMAALDALGDDPDTKVLFHDAVRPFVNDRILEDCVDALDDYDAVDTAIPSADTIIQVDSASHITGIPNRSTLRRGQTPQAFRLGTIRKAYELASHDKTFHATDDCGVVFTYLPDTPIFVVDGTAENMKVTEPIDVHIADKLFQLQAASLTADDTLPDLTGKVIVVFGGSYGIGESIVELAEQAGATVHQFSRSSTHTDVRYRADIKKSLKQAHAESGRIDAVVLSAGVLRMGPLTATKVKHIESSIETNFLAPVIVSRAAHKYLAQTGGQMLLFTSSSHTRGRANYGIYSASKAAVVNLTQALSEEWAADGVRINCINPQRTHTPMRTNAFGDEPEGSLLDPRSVAAVSLQVLDSDLTGQIVNVRVEQVTAKQSV
ncbi:bifunctional cytidylyltransferase/SDR family oxidoreductase [Microbacterium esteraromaticum]|uniref:bifunctional cytidylyltransferase/SDR family oxidoreductase n=1 Tax=Microbacterium esteraromaticum TaxID=57043 RepID=UPI0019D37085|nr:bifunctional cytidylyltransferase/SDR family oxidoreductase [Microbacterium esteraromaticum]MBN7794133.1 bifunctional cytidylyltransferase/SDR family oxidoreductase [Microbacterium esteraromaticum]